MKKFRRMNQHARLAGVCSGLAYYFGIEAWVVKLMMIILFFGYGVGLVPYILIGLLAPRYEQDPEDYEDICE